MENTANKPTVLYVDDEEDNLFVFKSAFRRDYNIFTALSGQEGLEIFKKEKISVIITDQRMPHMTGTQFLQQIPEDTIAIRMIMTGYSDVESIIDAINTGKVYRYITKPWDKDELKVTIDNALEALSLRTKNVQLISELQEANENLEQKVIERTTELQQKNQHITDSIHYASRIQRALFTSEKYIGNQLKEYFIFFKPRDIVSGDFYWAYAPIQSADKQTFLIGCFDCTGHGVPGAFMSILNISFLNEAVIEKEIYEPHTIFNYVRKSVINALNPDGKTDTQDGMDAVLCAIDLKNNILTASCANNPLLIVRRKQLLEFNADKMPVGLHVGEQNPFTLHSSQLEAGDAIYLFSDGYSDQFGGEKKKKFMTGRFKELLLSISEKTMSEQKEILQKTFNDWQGEQEQVDDVLVIGIRI